MREPRPRHTLQVIRVPSLEVQDLGLTSFDSWLDENGYDKTNARNNRTIIWAREGGWHLKRCRNLETGTDDFWFIAFDGKGGKIYPLKTQRDYRAAYRKLEAEGYAPAVIEQMTTGAAYNPAYPGVVSENGIYGHSRFCNTDFDDKLACLNLSGV
jgi:hypothetical protein